LIKYCSQQKYHNVNQINNPTKINIKIFGKTFISSPVAPVLLELDEDPVSLCELDDELDEDPVSLCELDEDPVSLCELDEDPVSLCELDEDPVSLCELDEDPVSLDELDEDPVSLCELDEGPVSLCELDDELDEAVLEVLETVNVPVYEFKDPPLQTKMKGEEKNILDGSQVFRG